jgi:hypothetical protein
MNSLKPSFVADQNRALRLFDQDSDEKTVPNGLFPLARRWTRFEKPTPTTPLRKPEILIYLCHDQNIGSLGAAGRPRAWTGRRLAGETKGKKFYLNPL